MKKIAMLLILVMAVLFSCAEPTEIIKWKTATEIVTETEIVVIKLGWVDVNESVYFADYRGNFPVLNFDQYYEGYKSVVIDFVSNIGTTETALMRIDVNGSEYERFYINPGETLRKTYTLNRGDEISGWIGQPSNVNTVTAIDMVLVGYDVLGY